MINESMMHVIILKDSLMIWKPHDIYPVCSEPFKNYRKKPRKNILKGLQWFSLKNKIMSNYFSILLSKKIRDNFYSRKAKENVSQWLLLFVTM